MDLLKEMGTRSRVRRGLLRGGACGVPAPACPPFQSLACPFRVFRGSGLPVRALTLSTAASNHPGHGPPLRPRNGSCGRVCLKSHGWNTDGTRTRTRAGRNTMRWYPTLKRFGGRVSRAKVAGTLRRAVRHTGAESGHLSTHARRIALRFSWLAIAHQVAFANC